MFIKVVNPRFGIETYTDTRLFNKQAAFCLCTSCLRESAGNECPEHTSFMRMTRILNIGAPVFDCPKFVEDKTKQNSAMDVLYEPSREEAEQLKLEVDRLANEPLRQEVINLRAKCEKLEALRKADFVSYYKEAK